MTAIEATKTILVVDDARIDRRLICGLLEREPEWRVVAVENGEQAAESMAQSPPDLVVTDLQMPGLDGLGLVQFVKSRWPNLPIVLVTGAGSEDIAIAALRDGAACYSPKHALQRDLVRTVRYVLHVSDCAARGSMAAGSGLPFQAGFVLENDCKLIGPLIEHLQGRLPDWSDDQRLQIGMALGEALINAMHHGNLGVDSKLRVGDEAAYHAALRERRNQSPWRDRRVHVEARFDHQRVHIQIADEGPGFRPEDVPDPTLPENLDKLSGRGLLLIRSFMDEVSHNAIGNQITMVKRRSGGD